MIRLLGFWLDLCLLRVPPQDLPASRWLMGFTLACYLLLSVLVASLTHGLAVGIQVALLDLALLAAFVAILLYLTGRPQRIVQTLSALAGSGFILGIPSLLLTLAADSSVGPDNETLSMFWLLLLLWNLVVTAHILRHALSASFALGVGVAVMYILVSTQFMITSFPQLAG